MACGWRLRVISAPFLLLSLTIADSANDTIRTSATVTDLLQHCQVGNVVFLSDESGVYENIDVSLKNTVLEALATLSESMMVTLYEEMDMASSEDIYNLVGRYSQQQTSQSTLFLVMMYRAAEVIEIAENVTSSRGRKQESLFMHTSKWLFLSANQNQTNEFTWQLSNSSFDNIAILQFDTDLSSDSLTFTAHTLMWRCNRSRELDTLSKTLLSENSLACPLFPNLKNLLNGRRLDVITKVHGGFSVMIRNNSVTGVSEYHGVLIDVLNSLSHIMNFTYSLSPKPSSSTQIMSWKDFLQMLSSGEYDLGLALLLINLDSRFNVTITQPFVSDSITGMALRDFDKDKFHFKFICPFDPIILLLLLGSYIITTLIYVFIVGIVYPDEKSERFGRVEYKRILCDTKENSSSPSLKHALPPHLIRSAWRIMVSIMNQAYLPRPMQMSARLLLFLWSLSIVMFYALYTGSLTATLVVRQEDLPFQTFHGMIYRSNYDWGTIEGSFINTVLESVNSEIMTRLYDKMDNFPASSVNTYETLTHKVEHLESRYVIIHSHALLNQILRRMERPSDFFIIKEPLLQCNYGFGVPKNSELGKAFSENIQRLHDAGIIARIHQSYGGGVSIGNSGDSPKELRQVLIYDLKAPMCILGVLLLLSSIVLCWEKLSSLNAWQYLLQTIHCKIRQFR